MNAPESSLGPVLGESLPSSVPPEPVRLVLTIEEAAERLRVGRSLMYALVNSGAVESIRIGRLHRVPAAALTDFVEELRAKSRSGAA
jgi:excisionase family DNA binding protein